MKKVRLSELSEAVKSFLASANEGMIVEDTNGESRTADAHFGVSGVARQFDIW